LILRVTFPTFFFFLKVLFIDLRGREKEKKNKSGGRGRRRSRLPAEQGAGQRA